MADRFEQWSRARLGEYAKRDGETYATIIVPVDGEQHDPRVDVIAHMAPARGQMHGEDGRVLEVHDDAEKPPTARHRKTRGK